MFKRFIGNLCAAVIVCAGAVVLASLGGCGAKDESAKIIKDSQSQMPKDQLQNRESQVNKRRAEKKEADAETSGGAPAPATK